MWFQSLLQLDFLCDRPVVSHEQQLDFSDV